jgi:serine/threonine-protein kinase PRP4
MRSRESMDQSVSKRGTSPLPADNSRQEAKTAKGYSQQRDNSFGGQDSSRYVLWYLRYPQY